MRRITPDEVIRSYQETGIQPIFGEWGNCESNCGCALTAVAFCQTGRKYNLTLDEVIEMLESESLEDLQYLLGEDMSKDYVNGFLCGFDDASPDAFAESFVCAFNSDQFEMGFSDGLAVREKVKEVFNVVD